MDHKSVQAKIPLWKRLFRFVDGLRRLILNLLFWGALILLGLALLPDSVQIQENSLLYLRPEGVLVDLPPPASPARDLLPWADQMVKTSAIRMGEVLRAAAGDERITGAVLDLSEMQYASLAVLQDLEQDLAAFRAGGKKLYAWAPYYNQYAYYLASGADRIYMDEMGRVVLAGFGVYRSYFREGMDKWDLGMAVFQAGSYKSFVEPYLYDRMSEGVKRENRRWTGDLWEQFLQRVAENRGLPADRLAYWIQEYAGYLNQAGGEESAAARDAGLADSLGTWREFSEDMIRITGFDAEQKSFRSIPWEEYLTARERGPSMDLSKTVAVVCASGEIHEGEGTPWTIGADSLIRRLEEAEAESSVRALVLRLDTGGGSAYASELIRRALRGIRERGIPVVVSMGGTAASGGYWIASESDQLWSAPGTITGSIGVFSLLPETDRFLEEHLGVRGDGVGTTWMTGQERPDQRLNPSFRQVLQSGVDSTYRRFLALVSENREIPREELIPLAEGRIWTGREAREKGLADRTGSLREAVQAAADLAHMGEYGTWYVEPAAPSLREMLGAALPSAGRGDWRSLVTEVLWREAAGGERPLRPGLVYALSPVAAGQRP